MRRMMQGDWIGERERRKAREAKRDALWDAVARGDLEKAQALARKEESEAKPDQEDSTQ